jgi:porphobilinogen synthase
MVLLVTEEEADRPMPTLTVSQIPAAMREVRRFGIRSVKVFAESTQRDAAGEFSAIPDALMARAVRAAKDAEPEIAVMTETCLCSYTDTGFCYVTDRHGRPDIAATTDVTSKQVVAHAAAGADIVGPASMIVGATKCARDALNAAGHESVSIMPHVIFWSNLYDGFRLTMGATPQAGSDREFQISPGKPEQFIDTALQLIGSGADMLLLEPAMFSADVLSELKRRTLAPLFPFSVSGEYTALSRMDSATGERDVRRLVELSTMLKRAGAEACITYAALDIARYLNN